MSDLPKVINLGCGRTYMPNFLNIDTDPDVKPDMVLDISVPLTGQLPFGYFDTIGAHDVLEHIPNLIQAMTNCRDILKEGGLMDIIVPYDLSYGAWQDPTHVRAFNEKSWLYYYDWAWYLKWKDFGLRMLSCDFFSLEGTELVKKESMSSTVPRSIDVMRVLLRKERLPNESIS